MKVQEIALLAQEAVFEALKSRGHDVVSHQTGAIAGNEHATTFVSFVTGDGTQLVSFQIRVSQIEKMHVGGE